METEALIQRLNWCLANKHGPIVIDATAINKLLTRLNSLEQALADLLRINHEQNTRERKTREFLDSRSW